MSTTPQHAETDPDRLADGWEDDGIVYTAGGCHTRTFYHAEREVRITYDVGSGPIGVEYFDPTTADDACWGEFHGMVDEIHENPDDHPSYEPADDASCLEACYALMERVEELDVRRSNRD